MNRTLLFGITFFFALVGISLMGGKQQAVAGHGWHGCHGCWGGYASYGCHGCWGGYASYGCHGCWGGVVSYGCHGCWGRAYHVRHRRRFSCYGCHGCYGSNACHGCHGCHACHGCHGGWVEGDAARPETDQGAPAPPTPPAEPSGEAPMPSGAADGDDQVHYAPNPGSVLIGVRVPEGAKLFVNGRQTRSTGADRQFVSRGLQPGRVYAYEVRAELMRGDEKLVETRQVRIRGGQRADVEFRFQQALTAERPADESSRTTLILRVPQDAKVTLAGRETKASGPVREFSTTKLASAGQWIDYPVRVEIERDGETLVRQRTITLAAGETLEETFDFDTPQVAQTLAEAGR